MQIIYASLKSLLPFSYLPKLYHILSLKGYYGKLRKKWTDRYGELLDHGEKLSWWTTCIPLWTVSIFKKICQMIEIINNICMILRSNRYRMMLPNHYTIQRHVLDIQNNFIPLRRVWILRYPHTRVWLEVFTTDAAFSAGAPDFFVPGLVLFTNFNFLTNYGRLS